MNPPQDDIYYGSGYLVGQVLALSIMALIFLGILIYLMVWGWKRFKKGRKRRIAAKYRKAFTGEE